MRLTGKALGCKCEASDAPVFDKDIGKVLWEGLR